jgi:hypothetical protein
MQSWRLRGGISLEGGQRFPGHFLDHTVSPLYKVVKNASAVKKDHPFKRNYDDFNEFFWTPECLDCCYSDDPRCFSTTLLNDVCLSEEDAAEAALESERTFVADAMKHAKKSYLEKRSWFHLFLNFRRIYEFLLVTFQLLGCVAFGELLVWENSFLVQVCSSVFITLNLLQVVWGCMLAWVQTPPNANLPSSDFSAVMGHLLALTARYALLVFQVSLSRNLWSESWCAVRLLRLLTMINCRQFPLLVTLPPPRAPLTATTISFMATTTTATTFFPLPGAVLHLGHGSPQAVELGAHPPPHRLWHAHRRSFLGLLLFFKQSRRRRRELLVVAVRVGVGTGARRLRF